MIRDKKVLRPRYGEVDKMGYVYHANYMIYCHQARTELLRNYGINDNVLEENNIMLPVISFEINYFKPAHYDELLTINTVIKEMPLTRFMFEFDISSSNGNKICSAKSTVVFVHKDSRKPVRVPEWIINALNCKS